MSANDYIEWLKPQLLKLAADDRAAHPWRYYRLEHEDMMRMLDELSKRAEKAETSIARLRKLLQTKTDCDYGGACIAGDIERWLDGEAKGDEIESWAW